MNIDNEARTSSIMGRAFSGVIVPHTSALTSALKSVESFDFRFFSSNAPVRIPSRTALIASTALLTLVERFDIEPYSDFSAKLSNFRGLVLFCIDAKFCKKIFVGKL